MSSAATQAAPHLATVAPTLSPIASSGNRSYGSQSSQSRDQYYSQPSSNASPPTTTSAGRHTRRPSGNGATSNLDQQMNSMSLNTSEPRTSRQASTSSQRLPSTAMDSAPSMLPTTAPVDYQRGNPPTAPPRTSSNQRSTSSATDRARRADQILDERAQGSRRANAGDSQQSNRQVNGVDRDTTGGDATTSSSRTRRRVQPEPSTSQAQRTSSRETRQSQPAVVPVRSQARTSSYGPTTNGLSREGSEIIKREIISKPEVDLERERERQHMAETHSPATSRVAESDPADDASKSGSRSRHDNTASSSKREKNTKFGEYYLGNTLGEGEFGKVKMGWKQEGGVQVGYCSH
jgi:protein-serine/threonine kinase